MSQYGKITSNPYLPRLEQAVATKIESKQHRRAKWAQHKATADAAFEVLDRLREQLDDGWHAKTTKIKIDEVKEAIEASNEERILKDAKPYGLYLSDICKDVTRDVCEQLAIPPTARWYHNGRTVYKVNKSVYEPISEQRAAVREAVFVGKTELALKLLPAEHHSDIQRIPAWREEMLAQAKALESADVKMVDDCDRDREDEFQEEI